MFDNENRKVNLKEISKFQKTTTDKRKIVEEIFSQIELRSKLTARDFLFNDDWKTPHYEDTYVYTMESNNGSVYDRLEYIAIILRDLNPDVTDEFFHFFLFDLMNNSLRNANILISQLIAAQVETYKVVSQVINKKTKQSTSLFYEAGYGIVKMKDIFMKGKIEYVSFVKVREQKKEHGRFFHTGIFEDEEIMIPFVLFVKLFDCITCKTSIVQMHA